MTTETPVRLKIRERSCGTCTKCCEGYLLATVGDIDLFPGKPCHFVEINSGCSVYEDRPEDPCRVFKCEWLTQPLIPEWLKPNLSNVIFVSYDPNPDYPLDNIKAYGYTALVEAGGKLTAQTLSWAIAHYTFNGFNLYWEYDHGTGGAIGSEDFLKAYYGAGYKAGRKE